MKFFWSERVILSRHANQLSNYETVLIDKANTIVNYNRFLVLVLPLYPIPTGHVYLLTMRTIRNKSPLNIMGL